MRSEIQVGRLKEDGPSRERRLRRPARVSLIGVPANAYKIVHAIRDNVRKAFAVAVRKTWTPRAALLASNGDEPRFMFHPSKFSRALTPETSGMVCVFSPTTQGPVKRRCHPNSEPCTRVAVQKLHHNCNTVDLVILSIPNKIQRPQQEKCSE